MGDADDLLDRRHGAEHVRHVGDGDDLGAGREELLELLDEEVALIVHRRPLDHRALALAQEMPGHDVGMVLHDGEDDLVPLPDIHAPEGVRHEVVGFRGRLGEDDLVDGPGVEELAYGFAGALEAFGRHIRHVVQAAVNVGIACLHGVDHGVDHRARLLGRGGRVEIDERLAIDLLRQDRKLRPDGFDVVWLHRSVHRPNLSSSFVITGLVPAIHDFTSARCHDVGWPAQARA